MTNTKNTSDSQHEQRSSQETQNSRETAEQDVGSSGVDDTEDHSHSHGNDNSGTRHNTPDSTADRRPSPMRVLRQAREQLAELTGMTAESVSSFERTEEGWALEVEVLELERVPDTMSLMAGYQVELDHDGQLTGYRRVRRYERGRADGRRSGG
ncbi:gas vesicle protein [Streptomyces sp. NPDC052020]|uniref:gas vesicle protein GvpO n=1 Tax=Streptomyces sp. NPDC052020 TaxID=3155677 RepID=UPI00341CB24E